MDSSPPPLPPSLGGGGGSTTFTGARKKLILFYRHSILSKKVTLGIFNQSLFIIKDKLNISLPLKKGRLGGDVGS